MEYTPPLQSIDRRLNCVCLGWLAKDMVEYTLMTLKQLHVRFGSTLSNGQWHSIEPLSSVKSIEYFQQSSPAYYYNL